jgi:hypothetical protein
MPREAAAAQGGTLTKPPLEKSRAGLRFLSRERAAKKPAGIRNISGIVLREK